MHYLQASVKLLYYLLIHLCIFHIGLLNTYIFCLNIQQRNVSV